jgi:glycosyltransferase involved in cell wall biosynthesis
MRERFGADAAVLVTPVDRDLFHRVPVTIETPRPRVLMLHHDYAWKGVADGLEAVSRARARGAALHLAGFGVKAPRDGTPYDEFHANPPQSELGGLYSGADVYLCPSWDEGLGMPSMEAMACGAALVTYDNGGCRDYARNGVTALVARRRDVGDLATSLASWRSRAPGAPVGEQELVTTARLGARGDAHGGRLGRDHPRATEARRAALSGSARQVDTWRAGRWARPQQQARISPWAVQRFDALNR